MKTILALESDDDGNFWINAACPIEVLTEKTSPHRVAIRVGMSGGNTEAGTTHASWLRMERVQAYHVVDLLKEQLASAASAGAEPVTRNTLLKAIRNGGINHENGNMVFLFEGLSGLEQRMEIPFDQSGLMAEFLASAAESASKWADERKLSVEGDVTPVDLQPREVESVTIGVDAASRRPLLVVRLIGGLQFSFQLDQKILEELRRKRSEKNLTINSSGSRYQTVAEDIEWLHEEWCGLFEPPSTDDLRRGSAVLRRLLVNEAIHNAWHHHGFPDQAHVIAPDFDALAIEDGFETAHVIALIVGGATVNGIQIALTGGLRAYNATTGKGPDADEGFAVKVLNIARDACTPREADPSNAVDSHANRDWRLLEYLNSTGAVRFGKAISRLDIIKYFANHAGGVHLNKGKRTDKTDYALIDDLRGKVVADKMDGLDFALLSIGQSIGRSPDLLDLAKKIRGNAQYSAP